MAPTVMEGVRMELVFEMPIFEDSTALGTLSLPSVSAAFCILASFILLQVEVLHMAKDTAQVALGLQPSGLLILKEGELLSSRCR